MLDLIRKKQKSVIIRVVFWGIIATFVGTIFLVWGKGGDGEQSQSDVAAAVNKTKIGFNDYQSAYSNLYRLYQSIYRDQFTPETEKRLGLRQQALDGLIDETLLLQEASRLGLSVSKQELVDSIARIPAFQENGTFSKDRYLQVLNYQRLTPDQFEEGQKRQLLVEKVRQSLQQTVTVDDVEIAREYRDRNEKVKLAFARFAPDSFESRVDVTPETLNAFFAENREDFRRPETVNLRYIVIDPSRFEKDVTFDESELEKFYRRHLDRFEIPEQMKASHILIKVPDGADQTLRDKKRELAEKILQQAKAGADFAELARKNSDDTGSASAGGSLGNFTRGAMVPAFEKAAFALKPGELSGLVETPFGFHIIKAESYTESSVRPLDQVVEEVRSGLRQEKARELAYEKAMDAYNIHRKDGDLDAIAKEHDLSPKETGFFSRSEEVPGFGEAAEINTAAFLLQKGEVGKPIVRNDGILLFRLNDRRESRLPELAEVRPAVEQAYRQEKSRELAKRAAERALVELKQGKPLAEVARKDGAKVDETDLFSRSFGNFIPRLGESEPLAKAAFDLTDGNPAPEVYEVEGNYVVAALKEREAADPAKLDPALHDQLRDDILARKREEAVKAKVKALREGAEITIAPALQTALAKEEQ